jgi:hypothetical protein|tara:strand:- start:11971 stop:12150 length:180 start_codon:yes stop_codon:yes gene_type:complete
MAEKLNELAWGYAGAAEQMMKRHMFFSLSVVGIITGMIEAAIIGFIALYALGWLCNKFV